MKKYKVLLRHRCGLPMMVLFDTDSNEDPGFRTWAICNKCQEAGLIHVGQWVDPRQVPDAEFFGKTPGRIM